MTRHKRKNRPIIIAKSIITSPTYLCFIGLDNFKLINNTFGIAISRKDGNNFSELSKKADVTLYEVKRNTKKGYKVYDASN